MSAREAVDGGDPGIDLTHRAGVRELGETDAGGVAVRLGREAAHEDPLHRYPVLVRRRVVVVLAADDVGVHPGAADVLSDRVDDQELDLREGQARQPLLGHGQELRLAREEVARRDRGDETGLVIGVLHERQASDHLAAPQDDVGDAANDLEKAEVEDRPMIDLRAFVLAEADQHLVKPRFHGADEAGVRLHAADDQDVVALEGVLVEVNRNTLGGRVEHDGLHRGADLGAGEGFCNAVALDDAPLPLRGPAAVAPHRRDDHRLRAQRAHVVAHRLDDERDVRDPAAARRDRGGLAGPDFPAEIQRAELAMDLRRDVRDAGRLESLPDAEHPGKRSGIVHAVTSPESFPWLRTCARDRPPCARSRDTS